MTSKDFLPFSGLPLHPVCFAMQKAFKFDVGPCVAVISCAFGGLSRKSLPGPMAAGVSPMLFSSNFNVSDFISRFFFIHFGLMVVYGEK